MFIQNVSSDLKSVDSLPSLESTLTFDEVQALVYITGYVTRKDNIGTDSTHTFFYYEKCGQFTQYLNRRGLNIPNDAACQWCVFCFFLFLVVKKNVCRKSLSDIFQFVSEFYMFDMTLVHCHSLANILLNRLCKSETPLSSKEPAQKLLKLQ